MQILETFYNELQNLKVYSDSVGKKRDEIYKIASQFSKNIKNMSLDSALQDKNEDISAMFEAKLRDTKNIFAQWQEKYNTMKENEIFRSELQNSFIVIIYGKVKAGKSSLANFIINNRIPKNSLYSIIEYQKAGQKKHKLERDSRESSPFAVNVLECTSEIQAFKLGGMAFVDTPGLSSMTKENGDLARQYINAADYIIFPTSSDSPLQRDEIMQIKELAKQNKKFHILITKSDIFEQDEVNGEIVKIYKNKSPKNRAEQEEDIKKRLKEAISDYEKHIEGEIMSISTFMAQMALDSCDSSAFQGSNISAFYDSLTHILTQKAQYLKQESPYKSLSAFIDEILESIQSIAKMFSDAQNELESYKNQCHHLARKLKTDIKRKVRSKKDQIEQCIIEENRGNVVAMTEMFLGVNKKSSKKRTLEALQDELSLDIREHIDTELQKIMMDFSITMNETIPPCDMRIEEQYSYEVRDDRNFFEKALNLLSFGTLCNPTKVHRKVGDNKEEVVERFIKNFCDYFIDKYLAQCIENIENELFMPYRNLFDEIQNHIGQLEGDLKAIQLNLKKEKSK